MNTTLPLFSVITSIICFFLLTLDFTVLALMLPKLYKQSKIKDIFLELRRYLFKIGLSFTVTLFVTIAVLSSRFYIPSEWRIYAVGILLITFSGLCTMFTYSFFRIFNLNFAEITILYQVKKESDKEEIKQIKSRKRVKK